MGDPFVHWQRHINRDGSVDLMGLKSTLPPALTTTGPLILDWRCLINFAYYAPANALCDH